MKNIVLFLMLILICGCTTFTGYVGIPTSLHHLSYKGIDNTYSIAEVGQANKNNWEFNMAEMFYKVDGKDFQTFAVGVKKRFVARYGLAYANIGFGARLTETDRRNPWLAHSNLLADVSCGVGISKQYSTWEFDLGYRLQHLSVPWQNDIGLNLDGIQFKVVYKF